MGEENPQQIVNHLLDGAKQAEATARKEAGDQEISPGLREVRLQYAIDVQAACEELSVAATNFIRNIEEALATPNLTADQRSALLSAFSERLKGAVQRFKEASATAENDADIMDRTRDELDTIIRLAKKGPEPYKEAWYTRLFGQDGAAAKWVEDIKNDPLDTARDIASTAAEAEQEAAAAVAAEGARAKGAKVTSDALGYGKRFKLARRQQDGTRSAAMGEYGDAEVDKPN